MTNTIDRYLIDFERENNYVYEGTIQLLKYKLQDLMNSPFIEHTHYLYKYCNGKKDQHGGNHPRIHVHETFAHQIKNRLTMFT